MKLTVGKKYRASNKGCFVDFRIVQNEDPADWVQVLGGNINATGNRLDVKEWIRQGWTFEELHKNNYAALSKQPHPKEKVHPFIYDNADPDFKYTKTWPGAMYGSLKSSIPTNYEEVADELLFYLTRKRALEQDNGEWFDQLGEERKKGV
ncbi:hypothetical protein [Fictibacillus fluitans]|uniref:Uncharacterized protein n=1 Tax=Fictibacillus fluitans TaxID=3058422 RepID=A0ABT8HX32_9BACL|nr:hypothetical protein [Fictibacillus sp. NE201]MDN4525341.1 hypothetical protein [Fictibacillus sp. NE201]